MTKQDKELLLKDLCARLPYGIKAQFKVKELSSCGVNVEITGILNGIPLFGSGKVTHSHIEYFKPYLRPMSSMTDEEREEWADLFNLELDKLNEIDDEDEAEEKAPLYFGNCHSVSIDWLNKNMFDYHGLIGKGLALEAPEGMYNF